MDTRLDAEDVVRLLAHEILAEPVTAEHLEDQPTEVADPLFPRPHKDTPLAAQELDFGGVTLNEAPTFRADQMPYGGVKDSGNTREGPPYAVRELTEERVVVLELPR